MSEEQTVEQTQAPEQVQVPVEPKQDTVPFQKQREQAQKQQLDQQFSRTVDEPEPVKETTESVKESEEVDILSEINKFKPEQEQDEHPKQDSLESFSEKFNPDKINSMDVPQDVKDWALKAYKSMQADYTRKTQETAAKARELELQAQQNQQWTPEKIKELMSNEAFVNASKLVLSETSPVEGVSDSEWQDMESPERHKLVELEQRLNKQDQERQQEKIRANLTFQAQELQTKYANFSADKTLELWNAFSQNKVKPTLEHFHKILDYDNAIKRAVEYTKQSMRNEVKQKYDSSTVDDTSNRIERLAQPLERKQGESDKSFIVRSYLEHFNKNKNKRR